MTKRDERVEKTKSQLDALNATTDEAEAKAKNPLPPSPPRPHRHDLARRRLPMVHLAARLELACQLRDEGPYSSSCSASNRLGESG